MTHIPVVALPAIRLATPADEHLPAYDFTALSAINTCPKWGVIRYVHGKKFAESGRPVALEMGAMLHEAFAACRIGTLLHTGHREHAVVNSQRLFGDDRSSELLRILESGNTSREYFEACIHVIETFGWVDDDRDARRTMANAHESLSLYVDDWCSRPNMSVWIADPNDATKPAGVEIKFDLVLSFRVTRSVLHQLSPPPVCVTDVTPTEATVSIRYVGRMDGLCYHGEGTGKTLFIHENKSAARLNDAWKDSYLISHQITGYCVAGSLYANEPVYNGYAIGLAIPRPKRDPFGGIVWEPVRRYPHSIQLWLQWVLHTCEIIWRWTGDPLNAPMYSHSCNRYFRPCAYIPLCYEDPEEQVETFASMVDDKWSPLREINHKTDTDGA